MSCTEHQSAAHMLRQQQPAVAVGLALVEAFVTWHLRQCRREASDDPSSPACTNKACPFAGRCPARQRDVAAAASRGAAAGERTKVVSPSFRPGERVRVVATVQQLQLQPRRPFKVYDAVQVTGREGAVVHDDDCALQGLVAVEINGMPWCFNPLGLQRVEPLSGSAA